MIGEAQGIPSRPFETDVVADIVADVMVGNLRVKLAEAGPVPITEDTTPADMTDCTFTGYAPQTPGSIIQGVDADGNPVMLLAEVTFTAGTPLTLPGPITHIFIVRATLLTEAIGILTLDDPVSVAFPGQTVKVSIYYRLHDNAWYAHVVS